MMHSGPLSILMGAFGIAGDNLFAASQYAYRFDLTAGAGFTSCSDWHSSSPAWGS